MTAFAAPALPAVAPPDPTKHVNYTLGMVLGVADFRQAHSYLAGRDRWILRDLIGYGVAWGLGVSIDAAQVAVEPGVAVAPSGEMICVSPRQCADLAAWVSANRDEIERRLSPPTSELRLAVVVCYRECPTDDVPIPGEPCRTEEELMAPSRLTDGFLLELRFEPPPEPEEEAIRDFVGWLRQIPFVDGSGGDVGAFLADLRAAIEGLAAFSPPHELVFGSPPLGLVIPRDRAAEFIRAAFDLWCTELRPRARVIVPGGDRGCGGPTGEGSDCVLLGEVLLPLVYDATTGELLLDDAKPATVDTRRRTTLLHLRMLEEWVLSGAEAQGAAGAGVVAAASVRADGTVAFARNATVTSLPVAQGALFHLGIAGFDPGRPHVVSGLPFGSTGDAVAHTVEVIPLDDPGLPPLPGPGVVVRLQRPDGNAPTAGFAVEVVAR
jgi:hypothetical protein